MIEEFEYFVDLYIIEGFECPVDLSRGLYITEGFECPVDLSRDLSIIEGFECSVDLSRRISNFNFKIHWNT